MAIDLATVGGVLQSLGLPGAQADSRPQVVDTCINESATAIDFGVAVARGTGVSSPPGACKPVSADSDEIIGVSCRSTTQVANSSGVQNYPQYSGVPVCKSGSRWVTAAEDVREGDEVLVLTGAAATAPNLASSKGGVIGTGRVALKGWRWATTTSANAIGKIEGTDTHTGRQTT